MVSITDCESIREIAEKELRMRKIPFIIEENYLMIHMKIGNLSELLI